MKTKSLVFLLALYLFSMLLRAQPVGCATPVNLAVNGNFLAGNSGFTSQIPAGAGCGANSYTVATNFNLKCASWPNILDHTGGTAPRNYLIVDGTTTLNTQDVWREKVNVCSGKQYTFSFWATNIYPKQGTDVCDLLMIIDGVNVLNTGQIPQTTWTQYSVTWTATFTGAASIAIQQNTAGNYRDFGIDDIFFGYCCAPITVSGSTTICAGSSTVLTASGASTYTWTNGSTTATGTTFTATPTSTTVYTVTGSDGCSCITPATVTVTVLPKPNITNSGNVSICKGTSTVLTASGGTSYTWSPGTGLSSTTGATVTASPTVTTTYTITGSNGTCTGTSVLTVSVLPLPTAFMTIPFGTCSGSAATITASGSSTNTYSWSTGATGPSITVTPPVTTTYTLYTTGSNGCVKVTPVTVQITPTPTVTIAGSPTLCANTGTIILTASGATNYTWSANAGSANTNTVAVSPGSVSVYTVTGSTTSGLATCSSQATFTVTPISAPTLTVTATPSGTICPGQTITLSGNATGATSYLWSNGVNAPSQVVSPAVTTTYSLTVSNACGSQTLPITVSVTPLPSVTVSSNTFVCEGNSVTLTATPLNATSFSWSTGQNTNSISASPGSTSTYIATASNACGSQSASVTVSVLSPPSISITSAVTSGCSGATATLTASTTGATSVLWNTGATASTITVSPVAASTTYSVTASNDCFSQTAVTTVTINPVPVISVQEALLAHHCGSGGYESETMTASANVPVTFTWTPATWLDIASGPTVVATPPVNTTYTVTGTDAYGCVVMATISVPAMSPAPADAGPDLVLCASSATAILGTPAQAGFSYTWTPAVNLSSSTDAQPTFTNPTGSTAPVQYTLTTMDWKKCVSQDVVNITIDSGCRTASIQTAGVDNLLNLFPNPTEGTFIIYFGPGKSRSISILDPLGRTIFEKGAITADSMEIKQENLAEGIYFVVVLDGARTTTKKLVIKK